MEPWESEPEEDYPTVWYWFVFGERMVDGRSVRLLTVNIPWEVPWWQRVLTRLLLGSSWTRKRPRQGQVVRRIRPKDSI